MKITTHYLSDEEFEGRNEKGNKAYIDMREEGKTGQSPMEVVLSALCSCVAVEVVQMIKKRRKTVNDLIVEAEAKRNESHPRSFTEIHLHFKLMSPDANNEELEKVSKLALGKYCSVADSLKAEITSSAGVVR